MDTVITTGYVRGHKVVCNDGGCKYADNGEPVPDDDRSDRACIKCNELPTAEGHDPCIANLPGVRFACCGHGIEGEAYIYFDDGRLIRGPIDSLLAQLDERSEN